MDDRLMRAIGIPAFGLSIPVATGLFDGVARTSAVYWLGSLYFVALAAAIWHGNRWLLFEQRRHLGWFDHPLRKIVLLLSAIVLYTVPLTVVALAGWYAWCGQPFDGVIVRTNALIIVICVVFVTHVYETVFLIKERESDRLRVARLDRARVEAELAAFLAQVDPHFVFNSLNTLGYLIGKDPVRARAFTQDLADLYRYLLRQRGRSLVPLDEELAFLRSYVALMRVRFGDAVECAIDGEEAAPGALIPPTALQLLVENAVKHNQVGEGHGLRVEVRIGPRSVVVRNPMRPRRTARDSAGIGLRNLDERSRLTGGHGIRVAQREQIFEVEVPLVVEGA